MNDYLKKRMEQILAGRPLKTKEKKPIAKVSEKRRAKLEEQKKEGGKPVGKLELDKWFHDIEENEFGVHFTTCWECGEKIYRKFARHATAHLLPKKIFKSVATHELNYMIYGAGCGCHEKTHRVDKFIQMKTFPEAGRRIKIMMKDLPIDELRHISNQLLIALDNI